MSGTVRISGFVSAFSFLSGLSLVFFGLASLAFSGLAGGVSGALVGAALTVHGVYELRQRSVLLRNPTMAVARKLAWNQGALAGSVTLYLGWQMAAIDREEIAAMLKRDPLVSLLEQMPAGSAEQINRELPRLLASFYGLAALLVIFGCVGMALLYLRSVRERD